MHDSGSRHGNKAAYVAAAGLAALALSGLLWHALGGTVWTVAFLLSQLVVVSLVIWQACDPFAEAAQWIGTRFRLPGSVRGATLDAVASSMPELFSGMFFVFLAVFAADEAQRTQAGGDGFGAAVATCAGSAVYNMILIPAVCVLVISFTRRTRPTIDVASIVLSRDGMWFLCCELLLIAFLFQPTVGWWMAVVFLALYVNYVKSLYFDARRFQQAMQAVHGRFGSQCAAVSADQVSGALEDAGIGSSRALLSEVCSRIRREGVAEAEAEAGGDKPPGGTRVLFGLFEVRLHVASAWAVILVSTLVTAVACYWLVEVTRWLAQLLGVPVFFVAVILVAAVSSLPDTFLSVGAAMRGDDDGAVSNAFGSNIFDICVCMSLPLLVATYLNGWEPISLTQDGRPLPGLVGIRVMLCTLTTITLVIMWHKRQLNRRKAVVLCGLYGLFVAYAVGGSLGFTFDMLLR